MCAIIGALVGRIHTAEALARVNEILEFIWQQSHERGRDGRGWLENVQGNFHPQYSITRRKEREVCRASSPRIMHNCRTSVVIGNTRAEPTTEYVKNKNFSDQQPYIAGEWAIVHNGTIANDKALRTGTVKTEIDSAAIAELLERTGEPNLLKFHHAVNQLHGSYAILATHKAQPDRIYVACNYRPIWYIKTELGLFFASAEEYFPQGHAPQRIEPYTATCFYSPDSGVGCECDVLTCGRPRAELPGRALVVCSGGLDSVVAATYAQKFQGLEITLINFQYGSRAETREYDSVRAVGKALRCPVVYKALPVYSPSDSPLLQADAKVAGGEAGAEFAHEWVPARNLLLLAVATAYAEANGFQFLVLGNNLEEAGAYPDNEPEFIKQFNKLLPNAIGDGKRLQVIMPVGNLMKHEIVELGHRMNAPMHLTWSCYRNGEKHCGTCGPCYMRRKAFEINGLDEVIEYEA